MEPDARPPRPSPRVLLAALLIAFVALAFGAMRQTSATFDEILFPAAGARALETGDFTLVQDHPRLPQYLYGIPAWLTHPHYPAENGAWDHAHRYPYARTFFFGAGNSPEMLAFVARLVALLAGAALVAATFFCARPYLGAGSALVAATLVAFTPDVLAHSGIAYNDVPVALALLLAVHAIDATVRSARWSTAAWAGLACGLALATKATALVVIPIALALAALHALSGAWRGAREWRAAIGAGLVLAVSAYLTLVLVYLGDPTLREWLVGLRMNLLHVEQGHVIADKGLEFPAFLLGQRSQFGWWYYFPVALALKTSAAFHLLVLLALTGAAMSIVRNPEAPAVRRMARSGLRAPVAAFVVIAATLLTSHLDIGTRHALPLVPFACILVAAGIRVVASKARAAAAVVAALVAAQVACVALSYPLFLSYVTEWARGRPPYDLLSDSSLDWGQGLLALRAYMRKNQIDEIALSYFGSALPDAYGIHYQPLMSHYLLPGNPLPGRTPRYAAISLTNMAGNYLPGDPFAALRQRKPVAVVGGVFWIFELQP